MAVDAVNPVATIPAVRSTRRTFLNRFVVAIVGSPVVVLRGRENSNAKNRSKRARSLQPRYGRHGSSF